MSELPTKAYLNLDKKTNEIITIGCEAQLNQSLSSKILRINSTCFDLIKEKYQNTAFVVSDGGLVLFTLKNAIIIKELNSKDDKIKIISGKNTYITNLTSVAIDKGSKNIVIVNDHKSVLIFNQKINGDVGPIKQFSISKVVVSEHIEIDEDNHIIKIFDINKELIEEFYFNAE